MSPMLPAICETCGTVFASGIVGENSQNITFKGCTAGPCPTCGGMGVIPDGVYDFADETISALALNPVSGGQLARITEIIRQAQAQGHDPETVTAALEAESPMLGALVRRLLIPRDAASFYGFLAVLLALIALVRPPTNGGTLTPQEIQAIIDKAVAAAIVDARAKPAPPPVATTQAPATMHTEAKRPAAKKRPKKPPKTHGRDKKKRK